MKIKLETYTALPCTTKTFKINGVNADVSDFGSNEDSDPEKAPQYGCGCHKFVADIHKAEAAIEKYHITLHDFVEICDLLTKKLNVGRCEWCV